LEFQELKMDHSFSVSAHLQQCLRNSADISVDWRTFFFLFYDGRTTLKNSMGKFQWLLVDSPQTNPMNIGTLGVLVTGSM
jgi:hypothetical protein